jgi:hypothetical protein
MSLRGQISFLQAKTELSLTHIAGLVQCSDLGRILSFVNESKVGIKSLSYCRVNRIMQAAPTRRTRLFC